MKSTVNHFSVKCIVASFALFLTINLNAQNYLGVHASNYNGVMGTDLQPASFVDGRFKVDVNLFSGDINFWQNALFFNTGNMPKWWIKSFADTNYSSWMEPDSTFIDNNFTKTYIGDNAKLFGLYTNAQLDILNFAFHIKPNIAIGFTAKLRSVTNIDDIDPKLAQLIEKGLDIPSLWNTQFNESLLDLNHLTWAEYGFLYSQVLKDDGEHFLKMGGKVKWLSGFAAAYMHTKNFRYNLFNADTSQFLAGDFSYGHSSGILDGETGLKSASKFGLGLDIGFVYEWRPDWMNYKYDMDGKTDLWRQDLDKYKLRAGISILDIGGMKFSKGGISRDFSINSTNLFNLQVFNSAQSLTDVDNLIDSLSNDPTSGWTTANQDKSTFFMTLPTAISFQFDYHIWKWFGVEASGIVNVLTSANPNRVRIPTTFAITPGFDHPWIGFHFPLSYSRYSGFKVGTGVRLGPLTLGVNDLGFLLASGKKINGATIYAGLRLPILYGEPQDRDRDCVSDKKDECIDVPGIWTFMGCPDTDEDGIKDALDACPTEAGLARFEGCPDKDSDSIPDRMDDCPELAGIPAFKGCPDRDNDSIIDPNDECPDVAGLAILNGCPDRDGDGIKDDDDACPDNPGPIVNQGCPDSDKDGLFDFLDECPEVYGPKENKGCPWPDTDNDGLLDKDDDCPNLAGPIQNKGCPYQDTDNDGVLDKDDKCPATPGPVSNEGCPEIEKEVEEILKTAFDNLEFETGKDIIKEVSFNSLGELADVLAKKPNWGLQISGHTDNVGDAQQNLVLSKKRAEAVKKFLAGHGVDALRLSVLYFGESMPIASNDTAEGRQKNRRVEMVIIFK